MGILDKVPGELQLYIGGLFTVRRRQTLEEANITHVLSVLRVDTEKELFLPYKHLAIHVDDVDDENLLQYFPATNAFIQEGLNGGGGVLVHCAMGKSRSATCVVAFLIHKYGITPQQAIEQIRQSRPFVEPNDGFMQQLELYYTMKAPESVEDTAIYQKWLYQREVELSRSCGMPPDTDKIRFEDEHTLWDGTSEGFEMRCRKCRRTLATSQYVLPHEAKVKLSQHGNAISNEPSSTECAHYFIDPLSWMRPELEQGKLEGRVECPKCATNVGKYAWQGMKCSCGAWVVPGISLAKGRIDEVLVGASKASKAIRRPAMATAAEEDDGPFTGNL
ncbi:dual specificity protein phosphatase 12 [Eremomyces bilateralis CBS 781.70]|uniref:protein-tyrosine-phosphatase n=1 Tax=Eremomyces bilateralis CBS 781.70 TaxID=1392243 RepID=A0A6G1FX73_9PEZI|nr:dual specificity protein phosphatase 12 [Eremomyces bilateralis CBS 781.70]KAF1810219.1 dual specificity protein phosphatase 12 [Eremomyces bilateralis CBS 781.70]